MSATATRNSTWKIDTDHTHIGFSVRHMMITTVKGQFNGVTGELVLNEDPGASSVNVTIEASTIDTRVEGRDAHLRSADFFDVEQFPALTFVSRRIEAVGDAEYRVTGDLTIRGVTREVVLDVEEQGRGVDPWGQRRIGFAASTKIDRTDWGLTWNQALEAGGLLVSDDVKITADVSVIAV